MHHLKSKQQYIKIIIQHQQNVSKKLQLQIQNGVVLKIDLVLNELNILLKKLSQLKHENRENQLP
jgi:hypothetical protein